MKRIYFVIALFVISLLLSGCAMEKTSKKADDNTTKIEEWAASDSSIHTVTALPQTEISKKVSHIDKDTIIAHKMIDDIPVYELYSKETKLSPILIFLHEHEGSKEQFIDEATLYAQAGFFCVLFDLYGYGERTVPESVESIEAAVVASKDIDLLLEYYRLSPYVDNEKFILYGHSMGGSAIWHYLAYGNKIPIAVVACSAAVDFTKVEDMGSVLNGKSQKPVWDADAYRNYCRNNNPINHMEKFESIPMLVYQGMRDNAVLPAYTQEFERNISIKNKNTTFIYDDAGGHNVTAMFLNRILPFIKIYVR